MLIVAETLPKWFRGIGVLPVADKGTEYMPMNSWHDVSEQETSRTEDCPDIMSRLATADCSSLRGLWFGNVEMDLHDLYAIVHRHSYTLRSLTLCNMTLNTRSHDHAGILGHLVLLVHWLRRECALQQVHFYGHIKDQHGTSLLCSSDTVGHATLVSRVEAYICGKGELSDFPFVTFQLHREYLEHGDVFSVGGQVYCGSKWRWRQIELEEDHTWYVKESGWSGLGYLVLAMLAIDLLVRMQTVLLCWGEELRPWKGTIWAILRVGTIMALVILTFTMGVVLGSFLADTNGCGRW
ncbi:hypothetical protein PV10_09101 [Exophiala mesophila]|uniref:Uncharacterized protein n=1 Tax=Exophiala mesophila TaxID=212818 RepID=A0A0D1Z007_EXOME|nr:uncharacterized protein PV10_09101 [Exophiala mesophila]KIV88182.1 hypothetical protein PV10_09101 [Exophiala mesophila]